MGAENLGCYSNEALDAYLDAPVFIQTEAENGKDLQDYFDAMLALGVPEDDAEKVFRMSMSREDADIFFGDRKGDIKLGKRT